MDTAEKSTDDAIQKIEEIIDATFSQIQPDILFDLKNAHNLDDLIVALIDDLVESLLIQGFEALMVERVLDRVEIKGKSMLEFAEEFNCKIAYEILTGEFVVDIKSVAREIEEIIKEINDNIIDIKTIDDELQNCFINIVEDLDNDHNLSLRQIKRIFNEVKIEEMPIFQFLQANNYNKSFKVLQEKVEKKTVHILTEEEKLILRSFESVNSNEYLEAGGKESKEEGITTSSKKDSKHQEIVKQIGDRLTKVEKQYVPFANLLLANATFQEINNLNNIGIDKDEKKQILSKVEIDGKPILQFEQDTQNQPLTKELEKAGLSMEPDGNLSAVKIKNLKSTGIMHGK